MLLHKVHIENFRSIKQLELELAPLTILVGPNNSGKTNILRAIQTPLIAKGEGLLRRELTYDLGTFKDIAYNHQVSNTISIRYELHHDQNFSSVELQLGTIDGISVIRRRIVFCLDFPKIEFHLDLQGRLFTLKYNDATIPITIPDELSQTIIEPFKKLLDFKAIITALFMEFSIILTTGSTLLGITELERRTPPSEIFAKSTEIDKIFTELSRAYTLIYPDYDNS